MTAKQTAARWATRDELGAVLGLQKRSVNARARVEAWPFETTQGRSIAARCYEVAGLPPDVQAALFAYREKLERRDAQQVAPRTADTEAERVAVWARFEQARGWQRRKAELRMDALMLCVRLIGDGMGKMQALAATAERMAAQAVTARVLRQWFCLVEGKAQCDWMAWLLPKDRPAGQKAEIHPDAWASFCADYLRLEQPAAKACYRRLDRQAKANPAWLPLPSCDTFLRRIEKDIGPAHRVLLRRGEEALAAMGPKIARTRAGLTVLERVNADGHRFDVAVRFPGNDGEGIICRPMIVGWQDIASGKILAYRVGMTETSDLVRLSFCDMVREYGIPGHAHLDNGRAFASKDITGGVPTRYRYKVKPEDVEGVLTRLGVEVCWTKPYNGKAKPIERAWRDLAQDLARRPEFAGAWLGNNPTAKPENYGSRAVPYEDFLQVFADGIAEHNARKGRRAAVCAGRSFDETFNAGYAATTIKRATAAQLSMLLLSSDVVRVDPTSSEVRMAGNRYWAACLAPHMGSNIELRFDPDALHSSVHAMTLPGEYIGEVPCIAAFGWGSSEAMREAQRAQAAWKRDHKRMARSAARVVAANAAAPLLPTPLPPPGVTALFTRKGKAGPAALAPDRGSEDIPADVLRLVRNGAWK